MSDRPSWDSYFSTLADMASTRSTCSRAHVGCVLVRDKRIIAIGYNGAPAEEKHCDHSQPMKDLITINLIFHCSISVHAEMNAIADCARRGVSCDGATVYTTKEPCNNCRLLLVSAGVTRIVSP